MTDTDRRLVIAAAALLGLIALGIVGFWGGVIIWRSSSGEDVAPGIAALVMAVLVIPTSVVAWLAPSPLSKSTTAEPQEVVGPGGGPVPVEDA